LAKAWPLLDDGEGTCTACGAEVEEKGYDVGVPELVQASCGCDDLLVETALAALAGLLRGGRGTALRV
jgi:hypothetical protein